jgi:hypothetical protein
MAVQCFLCIFISTACIIKFSIYLFSKVLLSFRAVFCFIDPDYRLIRITVRSLAVNTSTRRKEYAGLVTGGVFRFTPAVARACSRDVAVPCCGAPGICLQATHVRDCCHRSGGRCWGEQGRGEGRVLAEHALPSRGRCEPCERRSLRERVIHSSMALQPFVGPWPPLQFRNLLYTDGKTPWRSGQPAARPLHAHRTTQTENKRTHRRPRSQHSGERRQFMP